jgi:hypothetical protein
MGLASRAIGTKAPILVLMLAHIHAQTAHGECAPAYLVQHELPLCHLHDRLSNSPADDDVGILALVVHLSAVADDAHQPGWNSQSRNQRSEFFC